MTADQLHDLIERNISPSKMSKEKALDILGDLQALIDASMDALRDEIDEAK